MGTRTRRMAIRVRVLEIAIVACEDLGDLVAEEKGIFYFLFFVRREKTRVH